jgi:hypothetical protein
MCLYFVQTCVMLLTHYSLQTPRSSNIDAERHPFDSNKLIADKLARTPSTATTTSTGSNTVYIPYMHQVPGVGGMVFFPEAWTEFRCVLTFNVLNTTVRVMYKHKWNV